MPNSCAQHISHAGTTNWGGTAAGRTRGALLLSTALQKSGQSHPCSCPRLHYHLFFIYQSVGHGRERVRAATSLHSWSRCAAIGVRKAATHLASCTAHTWRSSDTHCRQRPRMCPTVPPVRPRTTAAAFGTNRAAVHRAQKHRPESGRCRHSCALQSLGQCAVNFGPILLKLKYVTALAPVVDVVASPAAAELDAPCYPIRAPQISSFYARSTAGCWRPH